ncbi:MAG: ABC transporter substrate-binding protein [bacterium]|nr:ABC transporter substrate-binding protein [bacterium]
MFKKNNPKWPTGYQWRQFFKILSKKEKIAFLAFFILFLGSLTFLFLNFYFKNTKPAAARGGTFIEGLVGQPRFINPVYANSDVDRDLVQLIFSGLMKYDENMNIVPDLAERYEIEGEGEIYKFYLKENLFWQDNKPITADDVIFTIQTIQNPDFKSPLQANWVGIEVEKINDLTIKFTLRKSYGAFLENSTIGIMPKHIWNNITAENFPFESYHLNPIGSGPYKIKDLKKNNSNQISSLTLIQNPLYFGKKPYISKIKFFFFNNDEDLIKSAQKKEIKALSSASDGKINNNWENYSFSLPRYFSVFFNQEKSKVLAEKNIRIALNYAVNKKEISEQAIDSPVLPEIYGFSSPSEVYQYDPEKAKDILEEAGFKDNNGTREKTISKNPAFTFKSKLSSGSQGKEVTELQKCLAKFEDIYPNGQISGYFGAQTEEAVIKFQEKYYQDVLEPYGLSKGTGTVGAGTRKKLNEICFEVPDEVMKLEFTLITVNQPQLIKIAEILKEQWKQIGATVEIQTYAPFQLEQDFIKSREYEALLFGEVLGAVPDPFPFWHSTQVKDPGLNLALYNNEKADKLLEENRKSSDPAVRAEKLEAFQEILIEDAPGIFLYSPNYIYSVSKEIKGINAQKITNPSKRFAGIENWYIKTKRSWK